MAPPAERPLRLDLVFPALPPALDGIGDHTAHLARALAAHARVRVLTAQPDAAPIAGVEVVRAFEAHPPRAVRALVERVAADPPDWLLVQFNQFSYGRWGLNPHLPLALRALRRRCPGLRIAWLPHEDFVPLSSWRFAVMTTWQRAQFFALGRLADLVVFTIEPWAERYRPWFPGTPVRALPVGSNVPDVGLGRAEARRAIGMDAEAFAMGVFGTVSPARMMPLVRAAAEAVVARDPRATVLYVGPDGAAVRDALGPDVPLVDAGALPGEAVSAHLAAMDVHLAPFLDGVSARRGSFIAGLQHGVPSATTVGVHTDPFLRAAAGAAFAAAPLGDADAFVRAALALHADAPRRAAMAAAARALYAERFDIARNAARLLDELAAVR